MDFMFQNMHKKNIFHINLYLGRCMRPLCISVDYTIRINISFTIITCNARYFDDILSTKIAYPKMCTILDSTIFYQWKFAVFYYFHFICFKSRFLWRTNHLHIGNDDQSVILLYFLNWVSTNILYLYV